MGFVFPSFLSTLSTKALNEVLLLSLMPELDNLVAHLWETAEDKTRLEMRTCPLS